MLRQAAALAASILVLCARADAADAGSARFVRYRLLLRSGERLSGGAGSLFPDRLVLDSDPKVIRRVDVRDLEVAKGHKGGKWLVAGGAIGAGSFLAVLAASAALDASSDQFEIHEPAALVAIGATFTVGGAVGGYVLGSNTPAWGRVSAPPVASGPIPARRPVVVGIRFSF